MIIEIKKEVRKCTKCDNTFEVEGSFNFLKSKKSRRTCSLKCSKGTPKTEEQKRQLSIINKNSNKVKETNKTLGLNRIGKYRIKRVESICLYCNKIIIHKINEPKKYHKKCYLKCCGGARKGSGNGKSGWYKDYWCDSSWELAFVIYNIEHNIKFERNKEGFEYIFENEKHKYYPDFILSDNKYVEIKGHLDEKNKAKINQFKYDLVIIDKNDIKKYLDYTTNKYGKEFIQLYEDTKYNGNKCLNINCINLISMHKKNKYCCRECYLKTVVTK